jgi:hypothetical protein
MTGDGGALLTIFERGLLEYFFQGGAHGLGHVGVGGPRRSRESVRVRSARRIGGKPRTGRGRTYADEDTAHAAGRFQAGCAL